MDNITISHIKSYVESILNFLFILAVFSLFGLFVFKGNIHDFITNETAVLIVVFSSFLMHEIKTFIDHSNEFFFFVESRFEDIKPEKFNNK